MDFNILSRFDVEEYSSISSHTFLKIFHRGLFDVFRSGLITNSRFYFCFSGVV